MYINKIDDFINKVIDDFYLTSIADNKIIKKIFSETDYIKYQKDINDIIINFVKKINLDDVRSLVKSNASINHIFETIKRYIAFYLFLIIGFFYTDKEDIFINNVVEFTKNQPNYGFKIENFFNSESNSTLIYYNKIIHNIITLLNSDKTKIDKLKTRSDFVETIKFLNELGQEYVVSKFKVEDKFIQAHNIIKTLIFIYLYKKTDKKEFFKLMETSEMTDGEYMFIDIIVSTKQVIDYASIEKLFISTYGTHSKYFAQDILNFLEQYEEKQMSEKIGLTHEEKILELINKGVIVPIVDDFLLYHKDSERYDKTLDEMQNKKKEDTKIKYIINKLDKIKEYYSEANTNDENAKNEIKKLFYVPLLNRKAVLININEDISIINKFMNIGKQTHESIEYIKDLEKYKEYPYVCFNDFDNSKNKTGFTLHMTKTVNLARYVSFVTSGEFKQISTNNIIQTRVGSKDMGINIVGFLVPSTKTPLQCIKIKNTINLCSLDKNQQNGLELISKYLSETNLNLKEHFTSVYWIFNDEKDYIKEETYEQTEKSTKYDKAKHTASMLYDKVQDKITSVVINLIKKSSNLQECYKIFNFYKDNLLNIKESSLNYNIIEKEIYNIIKEKEPDDEYDKNEDKIYEFDFEKIEEAEIIDVEKKNNKKTNIVKLNVSNIGEYGEVINKEIVEGVCQHNISYAKLGKIDKKDFTRYSEELYKFIQQYVVLDVNEDYVCKSCGFNLNMGKFIEDGEFDNDTKTFKSFATPIDINLEDVLGYEKFKVSIRNIDKIIEKISIVSNILHLSKNDMTTRSKKKLIIKNAIDLIISNNKKYRHVYKERREQISKKYGIINNYDDFYTFDLDNSIFTFSSKDIDQFKPIKQNNIIGYIIFLLLMELNQSHIMYIGDDKKKFCNFNSFEKSFEVLFGGLKIIINNKGYVDNISNYKILCYIIFVISCAIVYKTKMWFYTSKNKDEQTEKQTQKYFPLIQKIIIHTLIDIINSILETTTTDSNNYLYNMIGHKFFKKIQTLFSDDELYMRLKKESKESSSMEKKESIILSKGYIPLSGKYTPFVMTELSHVRVCKCPTLFIKYKDYDKQLEKCKYVGVGVSTNCPDGKFHNWKIDKNIYSCTLCKKSYNSFDENIDETEIKKKIKEINMTKLAREICEKDGLKHIFETNNVGENICQKCHRNENHAYTGKELSEINEIIFKMNRTKNDNIINKGKEVFGFEEKKINYIQITTEKLKVEFEKKDNNILNTLMTKVQEIIGNEYENTYLTENVYIIDHDYIGNTLDKNIVVLESQNKIMKKENHPFFKTNVIYYTNYKNTKIDVFYDAKTFILLGFKEENKSFVNHKKYDRQIKLNYSVLNKLKLFGYSSSFIRIDSVYEQMLYDRKYVDTDKKQINIEIYKTIINNRITLIKKIMYNLKIILSKILNGSQIMEKDTNTDGDIEYNRTKMNSLVEKYKSKLSNINFTDATGNNLIFKHWKAIYSGINLDDISKFKLNDDLDKQKFISYEEITKIDKSGNILLYYIIRELLKLLEFNDNKIIKTQIANFAIDFINFAYDMNNQDKENSNLDVKRFVYLINSQTYVNEINEDSGIKNIEGIYSEYKDDRDKSEDEIKQENEISYDNEQMNEGLDVDYDKEDIDESGEEGEIQYDLERNVSPLNLDNSVIDI